MFVVGYLKGLKMCTIISLFRCYIFFLFPVTLVISDAPDVWPQLIESPAPLVFLLEMYAAIEGDK